MAPLSHFAANRHGGARMFVWFRPMALLSYEHVFCSPRTSTLAQRAREALSLTRSFLLLEDGDPADWEVGQEGARPVSNEPAWAHAHRARLRKCRAPRRGGQPAPPPQLCLCPIGPATHSAAAGAPQRGSRTTTGNSRVAIDL